MKRDKWITALRSGEYEQGFGSLRNKDKYCCLGVLAVVEKVHYEMNHDQMYIIDKELPAGSSQAHVGANWFTETTGLSAKLCTALAFANDKGATFAQIADCLEKKTSKEIHDAIDIMVADVLWKDEPT